MTLLYRFRFASWDERKKNESLDMYDKVGHVLHVNKSNNKIVANHYFIRRYHGGDPS
jgi:hypothetical protein